MRKYQNLLQGCVLIEIDYIVQWAQWAPCPETEEIEAEYDTKYGSVWNWPEAIPSNVIDERTWRSKSFFSLDQAKIFASHILSEGDKWLACVEIKKCSIELLEKLK